MAIFRVSAVCLSGAMLLSMVQGAAAQQPQAPAGATTPLAAKDLQAEKDASDAAAELNALPPCPVPPPAEHAAKGAAPVGAAPIASPAVSADPGVMTPAAPAAPTAPTNTIADSPAVVPNPAAVPNTSAATEEAAKEPTPAGVGVLPDGTPCKKPPVVHYDKKGRPIKEKVKKEKPPKLVPVTVVKGALTVDGLIAKADLNFQILDLQFLYIWVPGMGTAVISNHPFNGSKMELDALTGSVLTIKADDHQLQLAGDRDMLGGKKPKPLTLYVAVDRTYQHGSIYPEFGYGNTPKAPYNWPGTLADARPNTKAPPLPDNLKQKTQSVKMCAKNPDGTEGACRVVEVPMSTGKKGS